MANPILLFNVIHSETARDFTEKILAIPENKAVDILINSPGGSLSAGWTMLAALQDRKTVNMKVVGDASSMAFFFLLFATKAVAFDTSNFLIHRAASSDEDELSEDELKDIESRNKIIREKLEARIDENKFKKVTGKTFDDIFSMEGRLDVRLTAEEAKEIGLIDEVIILDIKEREKIEAEYYDKIAALATPQKTNINSNNNNMKLFDKVFGKDDPVLLAKIEDSQFAYSKLVKGELIKAIGEGEHEPISGTFEANDKMVTVVKNEITAVVEIDKRAQELDTLKAELKAIKEKQITADDIVEVVAELKKQHTDEIAGLKAILDKAKITASNPDLPKGEFLDDAPVEDLTVREKLVIAQNKAHEEKIKTREV